MVIPERVALEKIHLLPPAVRRDRGGPRRRRALPRQRAAEEGALLLRLPAAGAELYLHLHRDLRFLARGFVVEQRPGQARRAPGPRRPPEERLCFYTGRVLNRSDSFASLSTCAGLVLPPTHLSSARAALPTAPPPGCGEPLRRPGEAFPVSPGGSPSPHPAPGEGGKRSSGQARTSPQYRAPPARPLTSPGPGEHGHCPTVGFLPSRALCCGSCLSFTRVWEAENLSRSVGSLGCCRGASWLMDAPLVTVPLALWVPLWGTGSPCQQHSLG